jgi:hypothetical protein
VELEHTYEAFKTKLAGVYAYLETQGGAIQSASPAD